MAVRNPLGPAVHAHPLTDGLEALLGHTFLRPDLLRQALTHRSAVQGRARRGHSNERLEFVGDRVLGLVVAEWLAERFPDEAEGKLGPRLAHLVSQPVLAQVAEDIGLAAALDVSPGEARAGVKRRATVLADALEAAIGALYLDGGLDKASAFIRRAWEPAMQGQTVPPRNPKSSLQEWALGHGLPLPSYALAAREGPPHAPRFVITATVAGANATGTGSAGSKQAAEQAAAADLLNQLDV